MTGFIVFAHGSRIESANQAVRDVANQVAESGPHVVEAAFLELGTPDLSDACRRLISRGAWPKTQRAPMAVLKSKSRRRSTAIRPWSKPCSIARVKR
jgi:sirohydrochlorin ferrochelatase